MAGIHNCQIDSMIIAKKSNAVYLSDDLCFRKIATAFRIRSINSFQILNYTDCNEIVRTAFLKKYNNSNYDISEAKVINELQPQ